MPPILGPDVVNLYFKDSKEYNPVWAIPIKTADDEENVRTLFSLELKKCLIAIVNLDGFPLKMLMQGQPRPS